MVALTPWSLFFSWKPPPIEHHNGVLQGYEVNVVTDVTNATFQLYAASNEENMSAPIFKPFTVYACKVAAFTQVGIGPFVTEIIVQTPEFGKYNHHHMLYSDYYTLYLQCLRNH